jgi:hypothetical protein
MKENRVTPNLKYPFQTTTVKYDTLHTVSP